MSGSVPGTSGASLPKWPHLESGNEAHLHGKKSTGGTVSTCSTESRQERWARGLALLMCHSPPPLHPHHHLHLQHFRLGCFSNFVINGEALHPTGLCFIWFRATIFSLHPILPCSVTFGTLMLRWLQLIILLFRRRLMSFLLREQ